MRRGDVWTVSGPGFAGKPRPAAIKQDERFDTTATITICPFTSFETEAELFRIVVEPTMENGLREASRLMADKVTTVPRGNLGRRIGRLSADELARLDMAVMTFLGLTPDSTF